MRINLVSKRSVFSISLVLLTLLALTRPLIFRTAAAGNGGERKGDLHITKNCGNRTVRGQCRRLLHNRNLEPRGDPERLDDLLHPGQRGQLTPQSGAISLDSNVVLFVGFGDWAIGRCTLDSRTYPGNYGLCTFSDGVGPLAGFTARVNVTPFENTSSNANYHWDGTYEFRPQSHE